MTRLAVLAAAVVVAAGAARAHGADAPACPQPAASAAYTRGVMTALRSRTDAWGNRLLAARGGPTYAGARKYLQPLLYARGPGGRPLTASGVYYLPFAEPDGPRGAGSVALHVADGSQVLWQRAGGRALTVTVGGERYGSCLARLAAPALAGGFLPILETRYRDGHGRRYRQESFAIGHPLVSYVQVAGGGAVQVTTGRSRVAGRGVVYAAWSGGRVRRIPAAGYEAARARTVAYWRERLGEGMTVSVPEARVANAQRALLIQDLVLTWRYSIGNPYEEFSFPEGVDVAQVLAEHGFAPVARSILTTSLTRNPAPYPNWKKGARLLAVAEYVRLSGDRAFLVHATPALRSYVRVLGAQVAAGRGLLTRERYSSDIPSSVYGLHSQAVVWAGLHAIADVWGSDGPAATARALATRLEPALRRAVRASERRLPDGSLFLPARLLDGEQPYTSLTQERLGSYWNLVMPYALASGLFPPGGSEARGALRYMQLHGSRLLGLVRAGGYALYGRDVVPPASGTDEVYGNSVARFLADNDQPDQLVLSLYGALAAGMTDNTFVSGEAASVAPLDGAAYRAMYLPPNGASNAAFLETLRLMLVHETRDRRGAPTGLQLAYATPRGWLRAGRRIAVANAPTSFGTLAYELSARGSAVAIHVEVPEHATHLTLRLRLPRGERLAGVTLDGKPFPRVDRAAGTIDLSGLAGTVQLEAQLSGRPTAD
jgi:hypothetical protein